MIKSAEEFIALRTSDNKDEYDRAAMDDAPVGVWLDVIRQYPQYRKWVAHNKTVPVEILEHLCNFEADVRAFVAMRRRLPPSLLDLLSQDGDPVVRQQVAANKKAPIEILDRLAMDSDDDVARVAKFNLKARG